jgi:hypothetical protein
MNAVWIPVGSAAAIILLSLGVLQLLDAPDDLLTLELGPTVGRETPETMRAADEDDR